MAIDRQNETKSPVSGGGEKAEGACSSSFARGGAMGSTRPMASASRPRVPVSQQVKRPLRLAATCSGERANGGAEGLAFLWYTSHTLSWVCAVHNEALSGWVGGVCAHSYTAVRHSAAIPTLPFGPSTQLEFFESV